MKRYISDRHKANVDHTQPSNARCGINKGAINRARTMAYTYGVAIGVSLAVGLAIGVQTGSVRTSVEIRIVAVAVGDLVVRGVTVIVGGTSVGDGPGVSAVTKIGSGVSSSGTGVHVSMVGVTVGKGVGAMANFGQVGDWSIPYSVRSSVVKSRQTSVQA